MSLIYHSRYVNDNKLERKLEQFEQAEAWLLVYNIVLVHNI